MAQVGERYARDVTKQRDDGGSSKRTELADVARALRAVADAIVIEFEDDDDRSQLRDNQGCRRRMLADRPRYQVQGVVVSSSFTTTSTFTIANARHVASKIKTDLKLLQRAYGDPSDAKIEDFGEEAAQMLNAGYLRAVTYGYKKDGDWDIALLYTANNEGRWSAMTALGRSREGYPSQDHPSTRS